MTSAPFLAPPATQGVYATPDVNSPIVLAEGDLSLRRRDSVVEGAGDVALRWTPTPRLAFSMHTLPSSFDLHPGTLTITSRKVDFAAKPTTAAVDHLRGILEPQVLVVSPEPTRHVVFHLPNFPWFLRGAPIRFDRPGGSRAMTGRILLNASPWRITLDPASVLSRSIEDSLKESRGYAITYVGLLERVDAAPISEVDQAEALYALGHFLTIARGAWTTPTLAVGRNAIGAVTRETWAAPTVDPLGGEWSILLSCESAELQSCFAGFMARWGDSTWRDAFSAFTHFYRAANCLVSGLARLIREG